MLDIKTSTLYITDSRICDQASREFAGASGPSRSGPGPKQGGRMSTPRRRAIAIVASLIAFMAAGVSGSSAQESASARAEGNWQGNLQGALRLVIHVQRGRGGALEGTMDSPDQGAMGLPIDTLAFTG